MRLDPRFLGRHIKTRRAIDAVAVEQCHGRHVQVRACGDQVLGQSSAFEKAESRTGMEFNEHRPWLEGSGVSLFIRLSSDKQRRLVKESRRAMQASTFQPPGG